MRELLMIKLDSIILDNYTINVKKYIRHSANQCSLSSLGIVFSNFSNLNFFNFLWICWKHVQVLPGNLLYLRQKLDAVEVCAENTQRERYTEVRRTTRESTLWAHSSVCMGANHSILQDLIQTSLIRTTWGPSIIVGVIKPTDYQRNRKG